MLPQDLFVHNSGLEKNIFKVIKKNYYFFCVDSFFSPFVMTLFFPPFVMSFVSARSVWKSCFLKTCCKSLVTSHYMP